jgi:hypothetical protein
MVTEVNQLTTHQLIAKSDDLRSSSQLVNLKLKTVVKESHGKEITCLAFNAVQPSASNLFLTVGGNQATVYDDAHLGSHISVVIHYVNEKTEYVEGGELYVGCWINCCPWTVHPYGDACIAVAGLEPIIQIVSVVEARVIKILRGGHNEAIVDLSANSDGPFSLLASLDCSGCITVWNVTREEECQKTSITRPDATAVALTPDGSTLAIGTSAGNVSLLGITCEKAGNLDIEESHVLELNGDPPLSDVVECLVISIILLSCLTIHLSFPPLTTSLWLLTFVQRFTSSHQLVVKSQGGRIVIHDLDQMQDSAHWKVPNCKPGKDDLQGLCRSRLGITRDGDCIVVVSCLACLEC